MYPIFYLPTGDYTLSIFGLNVVKEELVIGLVETAALFGGSGFSL